MDQMAKVCEQISILSTSLPKEFPKIMHIAERVQNKTDNAFSKEIPNEYHIIPQEMCKTFLHGTSQWIFIQSPGCISKRYFLKKILK